jgi:transcriptional regulator
MKIMYIPTKFKAKDLETSLAIIRQNAFATLISNQDGQIQATHIPILLEERADAKLFLICHLAAANPQSQAFIKSEGKEVLAIFQGPHAYISPSLYTSSRNVPTWNYVAAHVHGILSVVESLDKQIEILEKTILAFEPAYIEQWAHLPQEYKAAMCLEITAVEIEVTKLEGKTKLSQNKTKEEQGRIANKLIESHDSQESRLGQWMLDNLAE